MLSKRIGPAIAALAVLTASTSTAAFAQTAAPALSPDMPNESLRITGPSGGARGGRVVMPYASMPKPGGLHTFYRFFVPNRATSSGGAAPAAQPATQAPGNPPSAGYYFETPASLACIYGLAPRASGCDPNIVKTVATGGVAAIGIIAAGHDTTALADLQTFSTQFKLPSPNLTIFYETGTVPVTDPYDSVETALDLEMAHALAPNAPIILCEGNEHKAGYGFSDANLAACAQMAAQKVAAATGIGVVSMSYGGSEDPTETMYESSFTSVPNVVFFASSGDEPIVEWPSASPNVVAVGGTATAREMQITSSRGPTSVPTIGQFKEEVSWDQGGGGYSAYFTKPSYQQGIAQRVYNTSMRTTPDVAAVADPVTGVWVYCSSGCNGSGASGWFAVGGTSVASPLTAAMTANRGPLMASTAAQLQYIYSQIGKTTYFDVVHGICGPNAGFTVTAGTSSNPANQYDLCTGVGSPRYTPPSAVTSTTTATR